MCKSLCWTLRLIPPTLLLCARTKPYNSSVWPLPRRNNDECKPVKLWGMPGPEQAWHHPQSCKSARRHSLHVWMHTYTHISGFKWWEKSLCHGSMMDHYGWATSTGKCYKAHWIERPEGGRTGFKERWEPYNSTPCHLFPIYTSFPQSSIIPSFYFLLLFGFLLLPYLSLTREILHRKNANFNCFPFSIIPASSLKGLGDVGHKSKRGQNT